MKTSINNFYSKNSILSIINSLNVGGAESLLTQLAIDCKKGKRGSLDIAVLYKNNFYIDTLRNEGVKVIEMKLKRKYTLSAVWKVAQLIRQSNHKIIFAQLFPTVFYVALASFFVTNKKYVLRETNIYTRRRKYPLLRTLDRFIYSRYERIICVDKQVENSLIKWLPEVNRKTIVLKKGIPIQTDFQEIAKKYDVIFVGRLARQKAVEILLQAVAALHSKRMPMKIAIVGDGPLMRFLKKEAKELHLEENVDFLGKRMDVTKLLHMSKLFILPSRWEGTPSALLEAMAAGLPVIATKVGGVPNIINDGHDGVLVSPNDPDILAHAIEEVMSNPGLMKKLENNAREKIKQEYSIRNYTNNILLLFQQIASQKQDNIIECK
ncbi:glycosyltransferase [candidate division WOR-3 bacterium]|nr:glycosyltransferase [candidate division WOR-3 bacterium]